ncbi:MAG: polyphosphate kinase 1 [Proteobacteria bacterium]|nr:polyphosphate kinase 1 [Pseudomonadota bacterium]
MAHDGRLRMNLFINRELSLLEFNQRVLAQATDSTLPLLERLRFLCISSNNLDEFFEIRVAGLKQLEEMDTPATGPDRTPVDAQLEAIHVRAARLIDGQYLCLNDQLLPELRAQGVDLMSQDSWSPADRAWLESHFHREVEPVLSPLGLDPARPFPRIQNKSLNFIVRLQGKDAFGRDTELAVVQVPRSLPRVVPLPRPSGGVSLVLLSNILAQFIPLLFPGMTVTGSYPFRVTRNSDLFVDEEEVDDLRLALEGELAQRRYGAAVRLETSMDCPDETVDFLLQQFALKRQDLYRVPGPVNLNRLSAIYDLAGRSDLKYPPFAPALPANPAPALDVFEQLRAGDLLLHHPFQSFAPVMDFLRLAASAPQVLAIKQTLYRVGAASPIVDALVAAAHNGKDVTTIIELRARFDEEANIGLANRLQEAGVHVMYGVVGYKTHAKMILVVRRETDGIRRYCHLGTGNYHWQTARAYTDYGLLTANETIGLDVHEIFLQLTSLTRTPQLRLLLQSPFTLHARLLELIRAEAARGSAGRITARMNALTEPQVIEALYDASRAGAQVDLVVRGTCVLRPGLPGVSDNIRVRSIVGRFLEHPRLWCFGSGGDAQVYCSSADWMERNFFRRVEIAFPILDPALRASLQADLAAYLADTADAWLLAADGTYQRAPVGGEGPVSAQARLLERYTSGREHAQP